MSVWYHSLVTENKPVTEEDIEATLQQSSRRWYIDGDLMVQKPTEDAEPNYEDDSPDLICGQLTFTEFDDGIDAEDEPLFYEWADKTERRDELLATFRNAKSMVSVQAINSGLFAKNEEPLAPLWEWFTVTETASWSRKVGRFMTQRAGLRSGYPNGLL